MSKKKTPPPPPDARFLKSPWFWLYAVICSVIVAFGLRACFHDSPDEAREKHEKHLARELGKPYIEHTPSGDGSMSPQKFIDENINGIEKGVSAKISSDGWIYYYVPTEPSPLSGDDVAKGIYDLAMRSGVSSKSFGGVCVYLNSALKDTTEVNIGSYESWEE